MDILTIGEVLIDLTQTGKDARGIPQFAANPGGAPANLAVAASRLGAQTAFIGKVGADAFGRYLKEVLAENKVDVSGMAVDADHPTTMAVVSVDATGERDFSFYRSANADVMLSKEDISDEALKAAKIVHFVFCQNLFQVAAKGIRTHLADKGSLCAQPGGCHRQICRSTAGVCGKLRDAARILAGLGQVDQNFTNRYNIHGCSPYHSS